MNIEAIRKRLTELRQLEAEWAGKGEFPAPSGAAIDRAEGILLRGELGATEGLQIYPLLQGGVEIVWESSCQGADRLEITIEIEAVPHEPRA